MKIVTKIFDAIIKGFIDTVDMFLKPEVINCKSIAEYSPVRPRLPFFTPMDFETQEDYDFYKTWD